MKYLFLFCIVLSGIIFSQTYEDVIYLKDGSIIRGMIIEYAPDRHVKIQSGRNVFVYQLDEIDKITKEIFVGQRADLSDDTWSVQFGLGTPRSMNLIGITKDFRVGENSAFFLTGGLGVNLLGIGFCKQHDYNNNGVNFSGTIGYTGNALAIYSTATYQWRIANRGFISAGILAGAFENEEGNNSLIFPTASFDYRF